MHRLESPVCLNMRVAVSNDQCCLASVSLHSRSCNACGNASWTIKPTETATRGHAHKQRVDARTCNAPSKCRQWMAPGLRNRNGAPMIASTMHTVGLALKQYLRTWCTRALGGRGASLGGRAR